MDTTESTTTAPENTTTEYVPSFLGIPANIPNPYQVNHLLPTYIYVLVTLCILIVLGLPTCYFFYTRQKMIAANPEIGQTRAILEANMAKDNKMALPTYKAAIGRH